ncbi:gag-pol precursor -orf1 [Hordeum vulgare]|nr:gag-pol precursor -orf1 [Hordeum vulgare]
MITFDNMDHPTSIRHGGSDALVLDPIIDGFHLTQVLMVGGSSLNLIYSNTMKKMGIDSSRIKPSRTTFKGVIPRVEVRSLGTITLKVVFGSPDNFRSEELIFYIAPSAMNIMPCSAAQLSSTSMLYPAMPT